ncbi:MAG TPA: HDOD domain-containing protein [Candidatus Krumholzibacteria bacterium]|nr:HDOD domain-containing protein [Candidatus Krumholzibacteria bacterium]
MSRPTVSDLVASTGELATLPSVVVALLDLLKDTSTSAVQVQAVLERDPAMTANVLKLANSAFYGARRTIATVRSALVMLGNRSIATLAFATGMAPVLRRDLEGYGLDREAFWRHCLLTGAAAAWAADLGGIEDRRTEAFTAGIVHDVGMLVIDQWLTRTGTRLTPSTDESVLRASERAVLGFDHAEAGAALIEAWGFPAALVSALRYHHVPLEADIDPRFASAVAAADRVASVLGGPPTTDWPAEAVAELAGLGYFAADFDELRLDLDGDLDQTLAAATRPAAALI